MNCDGLAQEILSVAKHLHSRYTSHVVFVLTNRRDIS